MAKSPEQVPIPELSLPFSALKKLFPELSEEQAREKALDLEKLSPNPVDKKYPFVIARASQDGTRGYLVNKGVDSPLFEENEENEELFKKANSILLFVDSSLLVQGSIWLEEKMDFLKPETKVWIIENNVNDGLIAKDSREIRLDTLEGLGLVARKTIEGKSKTEYRLYGRTEKNRKKTGVDITSKAYFKRYLETTRREHQAEGWKIDTSEIEKICRRSTFVIKDLQNIKLGFGVKLEADCGCSWHITTDGARERLRQCQEDCEGEAFRSDYGLRKEKKEAESLMLIGENIPSSVTGKKMICWDCGEELFYDRRIKGQSGEYTMIVSSCKCPNCGEVSNRTFDTKREVKFYQ